MHVTKILLTTPGCVGRSLIQAEGYIIRSFIKLPDQQILQKGDELTHISTPQSMGRHSLTAQLIVIHPCLTASDQVSVGYAMGTWS